MNNEEKIIEEVAEKVLEIEVEVRHSNTNNTNLKKQIAVNKILKLLEEVTNNDN